MVKGGGRGGAERWCTVPLGSRQCYMNFQIDTFQHKKTRLLCSKGGTALKLEASFIEGGGDYTGLDI